jgi:hypothetical protein
MTLKNVAVFLLALVLFACNDDGEERLAERARIEGQGTAAAEVESLRRRATEMEADLASRQAFYQKVRGTYEGNLSTDVGTFRVRLILVPSVPPYRSDRIRTLEEITADLTNLSFTAQVIQWNPQVSLSAVGCRVDSIRPDLTTGEFNIASRDCPNLYTIHLSSGSLDEQGISKRIADEIREGKVESVSALSGRMYPTTSSSVYEFHAVRTER